MTDERIIERTDGVNSERVVERNAPASTTVVERRGGGSGVLWALIGIALVAIVAFFLMNMNRQEAARTEAVSNAASSVAGSVENAAEGVSSAAQDAADSVSPD